MIHRSTSYSDLHRLLDRLEQEVMGLQTSSSWPKPMWDSPPIMDTVSEGPTFHITEHGERISIEAVMPGSFDRDDLKVSVKDGLIHVTGKSIRESRKERPLWFRRQQEFCHTLRLPWYVDAKEASAKFKNGVLTISLPRSGIS